MNFFKSLFRQEKPPMEYIESKPQPSEVNIQAMPKDQVKPFLLHALPSDYWDHSASQINHEISNISSLQEIDDRIQQLDHYLQITSHGLFLEVMDHYDNFLNGLDNIQQINSLLEQSKILAKNSREDAERIQEEISAKYLTVVYLKKRQERLDVLIGEVKKFEEICYAVSLNIKLAIRQGNLYEALELCNEAAVKLTTIDVSKYKALSGIVEKAEKRKGKVYVKMQSTLRELCHKFDSHLYENVLLCYMTIASFEDINKALQAEFMNSVSRLIKESIEESVPYIPSSSIERMVKIVPSANYLLAIRTILKRLTTLMYNHHLLSRWHEENDFAKKNKYPVTHVFIKPGQKLDEILQFYIKVKHNLLKNRKYIWDKIQQNLAKIVSESDQIILLKANEIQVFLTWLNIFIEIGEDFSGSPCTELKNSISKKCVSFFNVLHSNTWNRILNIIEAEQWTRLPIPKDFEIQIEISKRLQNLMILKALTDSFDEINFTFSKLVLGNPFESDEFNCPEKNDEELSKHSFGGIKMLENSPVLCTAGLNLIRTAGCYLELMGILTPVSFEVFLSLSQFYEFLVRIIQIYAVYHIFSNDSYKSLLLAEFPLTNLEGEDLDSSCDAFLFQNKYKTLRTNIVRIKDFLDSYHRDGINSLTLNHNPAFSIAEALVAIASSRHLLAALKSCRSYIDKVIPSTQSSYTDLFFNSQEVLILELEDFILVPQISKILKIEWVHNVVVGLKWEEKKGDVNQYVNRLLHLISDFKEKLLSIGGGSIPQAIQAKVLLKAASFSVEQLLEAYGKVKRCNLPGREQMKIDFKGLITGLNTLTEIRNISRFEEYIEIWSHSAEQICNWIEANTEFSLRVQKSLFTTAPLVASLNKASRNHMLVGIESVYRQKLNS